MWFSAKAAGFCLLGAFLVGPLTALSAEEECPASITVEQKVVESPALWTVSYDKVDYRLASITFYDAPPQDMASLVYDKQIQKKGEWTAIWNFQPHSERGYWLSCGYHHTNAVLSKQLSSQLTRCEITYLKGRSLSGLPVIKGIKCKDKP
jgi:hypothetical protein